MNWLKDLLKDYMTDEAQVNEFVEKFNKENPKHFMPKEKYNEVSEELKIKKTQLDENTKLIDGLKQKASSVEEYEKRLSDMQTQYEQLEQKSQADVATITKRTQLKELLIDNKMHKDAIDLFINSTDLGKLEMVEGKIKDSDAFVATVKQERAGLFLETVQTSNVQNQNTNNNTNTEVQSDALLRQAMGL
jgi:hypothetical protein